MKNNIKITLYFFGIFFGITNLSSLNAALKSINTARGISQDLIAPFQVELIESGRISEDSLPLANIEPTTGLSYRSLLEGLSPNNIKMLINLDRYYIPLENARTWLQEHGIDDAQNLGVVFANSNIPGSRLKGVNLTVKELLEKNPGELLSLKDRLEEALNSRAIGAPRTRRWIEQTILHTPIAK